MLTHDITHRLAQWAECDMRAEDVALAAKAEIERLRAELNARDPLDAMDGGMSEVEAAVFHVWGERCSDFEPKCPCCKAWKEFDEIERLRAGGCARDQSTTQYCAEAAKMAAENERLRVALAEYVCTCEDKCAVDTFRRHDGICGRPARAAIAVLRPVIRAEALEEAAKAVDEMPLGYPGNAAETALEIAAAIRAMK